MAVTQAAGAIAVSDVTNVFVDGDSIPTYSCVLNTPCHHHHLQWHLLHISYLMWKSPPCAVITISEQ